LAQLREEVSKLKVTGGMANPERLAGKWGIGLTIFGFVVANRVVVERVQRGQLRDIYRSADLRAPSVSASPIVGIVLWIRNSLTRLLPLLAHSPRVRAARADRPVDRGVGARAQLTCGRLSAGEVAERRRLCRREGSPGRPEHALADHVALNLLGIRRRCGCSTA
jgi:hypothetical protein